MEADEIEREIRDVLDSFGDDFWNADWGPRTRRLKDEIGDIGAREYKVYAKDCKFHANGEWLFDMCWLEMENGYIIDVPLILESEWKRGGHIGDDLQKLLVGRAGLRVMIFSFPDGQSAEAEIKDLKRAVRIFSPGQASDRYLVASYLEGEGRFHYCSFCAGDVISW